MTKQAVKKEVARLIAVANERFLCNIDVPKLTFGVTFELETKDFLAAAYGYEEIRFSDRVMKKDDCIEVVGHEVAHIVEDYLIVKGLFPKPKSDHGSIWKKIMKAFGLKIKFRY